MQTSYGEVSLNVEDFTCGTVRVLGIHSEPALHPRVGVRLGWNLREILREGGGGLYNYQMVDLIAELRVGLGGMGLFVGQLWPTQGNIDIRSSAHHSEEQITLACDLDLARLEQLEEQRNGQRPQFSINLWPVVMRDGHRVRANRLALDFQIPRDDWLEFLSDVRFGDYHILEIKRLSADLEAFRDVRDQLALARTRIDRGEYNAAVGAVRTALEQSILQSKDSEPPLKDVLTARTDDVRGAGYATIIKQIKDICSRAVHKPDATVTFDRAEALFIVRSAEASIALLGGLLVSPGTRD